MKKACTCQSSCSELLAFDRGERPEAEVEEQAEELLWALQTMEDKAHTLAEAVG